MAIFMQNFQLLLDLTASKKKRKLQILENTGRTWLMIKLEKKCGI